jgi:hypothetical protein
MTCRLPYILLWMFWAQAGVFSVWRSEIHHTHESHMYQAYFSNVSFLNHKLHEELVKMVFFGEQ